MAAYRRVYDSHHLQADCQEPGSAPVIEYGLPLPFLGYLFPKFYENEPVSFYLSCSQTVKRQNSVQIDTAKRQILCDIFVNNILLVSQYPRLKILQTSVNSTVHFI